jgi:hypothetical protein
MSRRRPQYVLDRIALEEAQARHRREAPPGCVCILCLGAEEWHRRLMAGVYERREALGEPPF